MLNISSTIHLIVKNLPLKCLSAPNLKHCKIYNGKEHQMRMQKTSVNMAGNTLRKFMKLQIEKRPKTKKTNYNQHYIVLTVLKKQNPKIKT
jgi:hypothetical protein